MVFIVGLFVLDNPLFKTKGQTSTGKNQRPRHQLVFEREKFRTCQYLRRVEFALRQNAIRVGFLIRYSEFATVAGATRNRTVFMILKWL
jgi:hypothetical protein